MPIYGDHDYDPNFDDSPPPTPGEKPKPLAWWRPWWWRARRNKGLIVSVLVFVFTWRYLSTRSKPLFTPKHSPALKYKNVDWRHYAYSQYVTNTHHLCNAVMNFEALDRMGSKAGKILMYPEYMDTVIESKSDRDSQLLVLAKEHYGVELMPIELRGVRTDNWDSPDVVNDLELDDRPTWDASITKFLAFNHTRYLRVLQFDDDVTILKSMDDLFLLPPARVAAPRAYSKLPDKHLLSAHLMLIQPSAIEAQRIFDAAAEAEASSRTSDPSVYHFDSEILTSVYHESAMVLPHRPYGLLSSEFRAKNHTKYHGNSYEVWNGQRAIAEASLVHFADPDLPRPWVMWHNYLLQEVQPLCEHEPGTPRESGCTSREIWLDLYEQFRKRRKEVCGLLSVPAPDWPPPPGKTKPDTDTGN